jgi:hypothetical protein
VASDWPYACCQASDSRSGAWEPWLGILCQVDQRGPWPEPHFGSGGPDLTVDDQPTGTAAAMTITVRKSSRGRSGPGVVP